MYVGIIQGSGTTSKAMVLNSTGQISGINYLQATTINAGALQIGSTAITATAAQINSLASITVTPTELNYLDLNDTIGITQTSRALVLDASGSCTGITSLKRSILISSAMTRCENTPNTIISLTSDMNAYNLILRNQTSSGGVANACCGIAFHADAHGDSWFASNSGLVPGAAIVAFKPVSTLNGQTGLSFRLKGTGGTAASTQFEALRIAPDGKLSFSDTIGDMQWNMLSSTGTCALRFGTSLSAKNCYTIQWNYAGAASDSNYISFDAYGTSNTLVLTANDRVGISTTGPGAKLHVVGGVPITMAGPLASGISSAYLVNQASAGSITDTIGAWVEQGLRVDSRGIYVGSDRRVKTNIADIPDEDGVEFVKSIKPKLYELKDGNKRQTGYIAEDLIESYCCMLQFCPSSSMRIEEEGDIDGCFINLDYMRVIPMLYAALRDCLSRIEELETKLCSR